MRYLSADEIADAFEAYRQGIPLDRIAGYLRITVAELRLVLGLPTLNLATSENTDCDLWRVAEAERQL